MQNVSLAVKNEVAICIVNFIFLHLWTMKLKYGVWNGFGIVLLILIAEKLILIALKNIALGYSMLECSRYV